MSVDTIKTGSNKNSLKCLASLILTDRIDIMDVSILFQGHFVIQHHCNRAGEKLGPSFVSQLWATSQ